MRFVYPLITEEFETDKGYFNTIVIENQQLLSEIIEDIYNQKNGNEGKAVVSEKYVPLPFSKNVEIIDRFIPLELNTKPIINGVCSALERYALNEENYSRTCRITAELEQYLYELSMEIPCSVSFGSVTMPSIIKHSGVEIDTNDSGIAEKLCEYMELVTEFDRKKLFFLINMRSFVNDKDMENFIHTVLTHGYHVIAIENHTYSKLTSEKRIIIDSDMCEFPG